MKTCASLTFLTLTAVLSCGCQNGDLSPEMRGLAQRPRDARNMWEVTMNQDMRMFSDDVARAIYIDHPMHLSPYPVLDTSGMPR